MSRALLDNFRLWWKPPRKAGEKLEREVSFLELFYDLVYVVLIAEVAHHLAAHLSWTGVGQFVFMFLFVIWAWMNGMFYHDLHGTNDISIRVFTFLQMIVVGAMAVFVHNVFGEGADGFAIAFGLFELLFTFLWFRTGLFDPGHSKISTPWAVAHLVTAGLMFWSVTLPQPEQFYVWGGVLAFSIVSPILFYLPSRFREITATALTLSQSSVERYGLITIIVLGEVIVSAIRGAAGLDEFSLRTGLILLLGMLVAIGLWWVYFDFISRRPIQNKPWFHQAYNYLHMPLMMSIAGVGAVLLYMIEHSGDGLSDQSRWMFVGFLAIGLVANALILRLVERPKHMWKIAQSSSNAMLIGAAAVVLFGFSTFGVLTLLGMSVLTLLIPVYYGMSTWLRLQNTNS